MARDLTINPFTPDELNTLGADIDPSGMRAHGAKTVPQFAQYLKSQGLTDDEVEATFLKNFGTTTYNADQASNIGVLKRTSPQEIRKRGVKRATGYEQIFFSPEERAAEGIPYTPAEPPVAPEPAQPTPTAQEQAMAMMPSIEDTGTAGTEESQFQAQQAAQAEKLMYPQGAPPFMSPKQLLRPLGFAAGAGAELGRLAIATAAEGASAVTGVPAGETLRRTEKRTGLPEGSLMPATRDALKIFAESVEEGIDKTIVDAAASEGADIIGGLSTMIMRDIIPALPGGERTASEFFETGFRSGEGFIAGFPVMGTFALSIINEARKGNFQQAGDMLAAKPVTVALILLPMIKKGAITLSPRAKAWVERTAGRYYAAKNAPKVTPSAQAAAETQAAAERLYSNPLEQSTEFQTQATEQALAEARAKSGLARQAVEDAQRVARERPVEEAGVQPDVSFEGRTPVAPRTEPFGMTELEAAQVTEAPSEALRQTLVNPPVELAQRVTDPAFSYNRFLSYLNNTLGEETVNKANPSSIVNDPVFTAYRAQLIQQGTPARQAAQLAAKARLLQRLETVVDEATLRRLEQVPERFTEPRAERGIAGERTAFESAPGVEAEVFTEEGTTFATRQKPPLVEFRYDPVNKSVKPRTVSPVEREAYGAEQSIPAETAVTRDLVAQQLEPQLPTLLEKLPSQFTMVEQDLIARAKDAFGITTADDAAAVREIAIRIRQASAEKAGTVVEPFVVPPEIAQTLGRLRDNLLQRFSTRVLPEGVTQNILPTEIADQVTAAAMDVMMENSQAMINSDIVRGSLVKRLVQQYGVDVKEAKSIVEAVSKQSKLRMPNTRIVFGDGQVIDPTSFEGVVAEAYQDVLKANPKLRVTVLEQIRENATRKVERFVFNETLRAAAQDLTLNIPREQFGTGTTQLAETIVQGLKDNPERGINPVIVADARVFDAVVRDLSASQNVAEQAVGKALARYETPNKALVDAGIVPEGAKVSRGFNESYGSLVEGTRQFQLVDRLFSDYKRTLTSRNLLSGVNNFMSNILLETLYYGKPQVLLQVLNPLSEMRQFYKRYVNNTPANAQEAALMQAVRETKIIDTSLVDIELGMADESLAAKGVGLVSEKAGKFVSKLDAVQDRFYKFGDSFFKLRSLMEEVSKAKTYLEDLPDGGKAEINTGIGRTIVLEKLGRGRYGIVDASGRATSQLSPAELEGILARSGARIANNKFVDYGKRPLYLNKLEELRYGPFGGPLITPFLTWKYKMMDAAIPYVRVGGETSAAEGASAGLPRAQLPKLVFKPGVGASFSDVGIVGKTTSFGTNAKMFFDSALQAARRGGIFAGAENLSQGEDDLLRKGASFTGRKNDPLTIFANQQDPRIVYGKSFSQLNFLDPSLTVLNAIQTGAENFLPRTTADLDPDSRLRKYVDRRNSGQGLSAADILDLAGYGGSTLADVYQKINDAAEYGNSAVLMDIAGTYGPSVALGTYGNVMRSVYRAAMPETLERKAGRVPVDPAVRSSVLSQLIRDTLGLGYKEAYLYGSLKSKNPSEYLDKAYTEYSEALYRNLVNEFVKQYSAAKEQGKSQAELNQIRQNQQDALADFKRIQREVADNYKEIVMGARARKGKQQPQNFPRINKFFGD